jgi:GT2 family glycosyltransferase
MISIVCTYFNRQAQLNKTLESFLQYDPREFNVVIIDDTSPEDIILSDYPFKVFIWKMQNKSWIQNDPAWNRGFEIALLKKADIIIIQNAECFHQGNILDYVKDNLTEENYLSFACYSLSKKNTFDPKLNLRAVIEANNKDAIDSEHDSWYNHPLYRGTGYHFCSAITAGNLIKLNGFDERYSYGTGYDDDDLVMRIKRLGLKIKIPINPFVVHQWHGNNPQDYSLIEKNRALYQQIATSETGFRAKHLIIPDL